MSGAPVTDDPRVVARTGLVLAAALVLQLGLLDDLRVLSVHPELLLAVGIASAVAWGPERGAIVGFFAGLLTDLILSGRFGVSALAYGLAGYGVGMVSDGLARRSIVIDGALMALGGVVGVLLYAVVAALFGESTLGDDNLLEDHRWSSALWNLRAARPLVVPMCRWAGRQPDLRPTR